SRHIVAFLRGERVITVVPRLILGLGADWGDTLVHLPSGEWQDALTGQQIKGGPARTARLLGEFPVALLWKTG
ncbi:MAG TPA: hypothetical protein VLW54_05015, partial [Candidatus Acidoferrales bacterium]|nr:hypothetical protein [Candidatus Acidoferrales bacterium]